MEEKVLSLVCHRKKWFFHSLPSYVNSSSLFKSKSSSTADALLSPEMGCGCRTRRTNLTVLYMVVEGEDVCYMAVRWRRPASVSESETCEVRSARHLHLLWGLWLGLSGDVGAPAGQSAEDIPLGHLQPYSDRGYPGDGCRETRDVSLHVTQQFLELFENWEYNT